MKKKLITYLLAFWGGLSFLYASHFTGGELSYKHLGGCDYRIFSTIYMDCQGASISPYLPPSLSNPYPSPVLNFTGVGCTLPAVTTNWIPYQAEEITPLCPGAVTSCAGTGNSNNGYIVYTYYSDVDFCGITCSSVKVSWSTCCRNYAVTSGASGESFYVELNIPLGINNSSPYFVTPPISVMYAWQTNTFSQVAFDADGDSLVYSLAPCYQNPGQNVTYAPGYSPTSPLGFTWAVNIDAVTGELTATPNTTGALVVGTLGIRVDEYRNGVLIGHINRDHQVYVVSAGTTSNTPPSATMSNVNGLGFQNPPSLVQTEMNQPISFDITVTDPDPGQLLAYNTAILNQFPGATLTASGNTSPMVLTFSWTPTAVGSYPFILDAYDNFCTYNGHTYIVSTIKVDSTNISSVITNSACNLATGAIDISLSSGTSPYTYTWSNGATTQDLTNIPAGAYWVSITDANGFFWNSDTFYVNSLGLSANINPTSPDCGLANGALSLTVTGGIAPYSYTWSNGQMGSNTISNLGIGGYSANIYDAAGCFLHVATLLDYDPLDSCASLIEGMVYFDANGNCMQDVGEPVIPNVYINIVPGGAAFSDINGHYSFTVYNTGTYNLEVMIGNNGSVSSTCLSNLTLSTTINTLGQNALGNDFPLNSQPDMQAYLYEQNYTPGFTHHTYIHCHNTNYFLSNPATVTYQHSPDLINPTFSPPATNYDPLTHTVEWVLTPFLPGNWKYLQVTGTTDPNAVMGDTVKSYLSINPIAGDPTPNNNLDTVVCIVGASFDPNMKQVFPPGETTSGLISPNTPTLEYTLHFQNTGNYPAQFVVLRDKIDVSVLDITTTEIQMTSHTCNISVEGDSVLVFRFDNINLPDSATDFWGSQGFVKFGIHLKPNLALYSTIQNQAAIYFDFNAPVITNTTTNTLYNHIHLAVNANSNICPGDEVEAVVASNTGRPPFQFNWSNGVQDLGNTSGISQIPANFNTGTHSVQVTDYYGLTSTESFVLNVLPLANATFTYNPAGNNYFFTAASVNNVSYLWDFGNGQTSNTPSATATYTQNGTYTVTLICTDACGGADTVSQMITLSVGMENSLFTQQVNLSPNPAAHFTILSFDNKNQEPYTLRIFDVNGKVVETIENLREEKVRINTAQKASGTYFWELKGEFVARGIMIVE